MVSEQISRIEIFFYRKATNRSALYFSHIICGFKFTKNEN